MFLCCSFYTVAAKYGLEGFVLVLYKMRLDHVRQLSRSAAKALVFTSSHLCTLFLFIVLFFSRYG